VLRRLSQLSKTVPLWVCHVPVIAGLRLEKRSFRAVHARRLAAPHGFELDIRPEYPH
jgi:hypothetical protein